MGIISFPNKNAPSIYDILSVVNKNFYPNIFAEQANWDLAKLQSGVQVSQRQTESHKLKTARFIHHSTLIHAY